MEGAGETHRPESWAGESPDSGGGEAWQGGQLSSARNNKAPGPMAALGLMVVGAHWVLGLASLPVPGMQRGQAARRFGGPGRGNSPGEGVPGSAACSCDIPGDSLESRLSPGLTLPYLAVAKLCDSQGN